MKRPSLTAIAMALCGVAVLGGQQPAPASTSRQSTALVGAARTVSFAGYSWGVKAAAGVLGPGPNLFSDSPENVWVDAAGQLHLRMTYRNGRWLCAEVILDHSLGYGTYSFTIASPLGGLDPNITLGLFTWDDNPASNHREIDVEFARWGNALDPTNAQFVVQPYGTPGNLKRFLQPPATPSVHSFAWAARSVTFASRDATGQAIADWRYGGRDVPRAGAERVHLNLWLNNGMAPTNGAEQEVVVSNFSFTR